MLPHFFSVNIFTRKTFKVHVIKPKSAQGFSQNHFIAQLKPTDLSEMVFPCSLPKHQCDVDPVLNVL